MSDPLDKHPLAKKRVTSDQGRAMLRRAFANTSLVEQANASCAAHRRGERGTPGRQVHDELRKQREQRADE